jgi:hypothetical protein
VSTGKFLETRRLRLYVVGSLRGLIKPYYEHGVRSLIREEMLLKALSDEFDAESFTLASIVDSIFLTNAEDRVGAYSAIFKRISHIRKLKEFNYSREDAKEYSSQELGEDNIVKLYGLLKEKGILDRIRKTAEDLRENSFKHN